MMKLVVRTYSLLLTLPYLVLLTTEGNAQTSTVVLDLNTDSTSTTDIDVVFSEEDRRTGFLENLIVSIQDEGGSTSTLSRATAHFVNPSAFDQNHERLELNRARLPPMIQPTDTFENGMLTIDGIYLLTEYEDILQAIDYVNTNLNPDDSAIRIVQFQVFDDMSLGSNTAQANITISVYNDPPVYLLGGSTAEQQNVSIDFINPTTRPGDIQCVRVFGGSFPGVISDPDSTGLTSLCFEVETSCESMYSSTGAVQPISTNLYCITSSIVGTTEYSTFDFILRNVEYCITMTSEPEFAEIRRVRAYAEDNGLLSPGGSTANGALGKSEFAFISVGFSGTGTPPTAVCTTLPPTIDTTTQPPTTVATTQAPTTVATTQAPTTVATTQPGTTTLTSATATPLSTTLSTTPFVTSTPVIATPLTPGPMQICPEEENVSLFTGAVSDLFFYNWTETSLGQTQMQPCPESCQELADTQSQGSVVRKCSGTAEAIAQWSEVDFSGCGLSTSALQLCEASIVAERVANITADATQLDTVAVSSATTILEGLTAAAIEHPEVRDNYLQTIDNILSADPETILSSQNEANSSARLLRSLTEFTRSVPIPSIDNGTNDTTNATNRLVFALRNFGVAVQDVQAGEFLGETFSVDLGPVKEAIRMNGSIDENSLLAVVVPNATASVSVGVSVFDTPFLNTTSRDVSEGDLLLNDTEGTPEPTTVNPPIETRRLVFSVFLSNSLFLQNETNCENFTIGSIVVSVDFNTTDYDLTNDSIQVSLQEYREGCEDPVPDTAMPTCARHIETDNGVKWTRDGCKTTSSDGVTTRCDCSQLGHFGLVFDIRPGPAYQPLVLTVFSYVGAILSIICLLMVVCTYSLSRELRSTKHGIHGQILINICIALIGFYSVFLVAAHVTSVRPLCGLVAALSQYFLLAYFVWTAVEAIGLIWIYFVNRFERPGGRFVLKAAIVAWCLPLVITAASVAAGHRFYINKYFCRSTEKPFFFGTLLPVGVLQLFTWVVFILIIIGQIRTQVVNASQFKPDSSKSEKIKTTKKTVLFVVLLAFLFGLGWGVGITATSSKTPQLSFAFQFLFCIFVGSQGILFFLLHGVKSKHVRKQWKAWFMKFCFCRKFKLRPRSPGLTEYGFQPNSLRSPVRNNGMVQNCVNNNVISNEHVVIESETLMPDESGYHSYREHANTVGFLTAIKPRVCSVGTEINSDMSVSGESDSSSTAARRTASRHGTF